MTPMTLNGWLRMRMIWPTGSASSPNSCSLTVVPSTATFAALRHVLRAEERCRTCVGQARMSGRSTSVPWMRVYQFWLPATTCVCGLDARRQVLHAGHLVADRLGILDASACSTCPSPAAHAARA